MRRHVSGNHHAKAGIFTSLTAFLMRQEVRWEVRLSLLIYLIERSFHDINIRYKTFCCLIHYQFYCLQNTSLQVQHFSEVTLSYSGACFKSNRIESNRMCFLCSPSVSDPWKVGHMLWLCQFQPNKYCVLELTYPRKIKRSWSVFSLYLSSWDIEWMLVPPSLCLSIVSRISSRTCSGRRDFPLHMLYSRHAFASTTPTSKNLSVFWQRLSRSDISWTPMTLI